MVSPTDRDQSLDQQRAAYAWKEVVAAKTALGGKFEGFKNLAKGAPALVMGNGLMPTLAFMQNKSDEGRALAASIGRWLADRMSATFLEGTYEGVMEGLHGASGSEYIRATEETLEVLRWIRQLAPTVPGPRGS